MLVMDFPFRNFNNDSVMEFAEWFRKNHQMSDLDYCSDLFDKLNEAIAITDKPNKLMKKTNIPILAYHVQTADEIGMSMATYGEWIERFLMRIHWIVNMHRIVDNLQLQNPKL